MKNSFFKYWWAFPTILGWLGALVCLWYDRTSALWLFFTALIVSVILFLISCIPHRRNPKKIGIIEFF